MQTWIHFLSNLLLCHQTVTGHEWASFSPPSLGGKPLVFPKIQHRETEVERKLDTQQKDYISETDSCPTHKILVVVICEEVLETAGPVCATPQQTERVLLAAHVAVPWVLFDGCMCRSLTNKEINALHTETPEHRCRRFISTSDGIF